MVVRRSSLYKDTRKWEKIVLPEMFYPRHERGADGRRDEKGQRERPPTKAPAERLTQLGWAGAMQRVEQGEAEGNWAGHL